MAKMKGGEGRNGGGGVKTNEGRMCKGGVPRMLMDGSGRDGGGSPEVEAGARGLYPRSGGRAGGEQATQKR